MQGLTASEVHARLKAEGFNELPRAGRRTIGGLILEVLREPMLRCCWPAGSIYLVLGDLREALLLLVLGVHLGCHHHRAGSPHRTRAGIAARSDQPARACHPRRRAPTYSRRAKSCAAT